MPPKQKPEFDYSGYPTPKKAFQQNDKLRRHFADLIATPEFRSAWDVAALEYARTALGSVDDKPEAVAYRLQGAQQFREAFISLGTIPGETLNKFDVNLPYPNQ